jgi:hypothetical protein
MPGPRTVAWPELSACALACLLHAILPSLFLSQNIVPAQIGLHEGIMPLLTEVVPNFEADTSQGELLMP